MGKQTTAKPTVLIVDDDPRICSFVKIAVEQALECTVLTAITGTEGLEKARREKPRLILLDIIMPDVDGLEVLRQIKEDPRLQSTRVVMLTGRTDREALRKSLYWYAEEFLSKPIPPGLLIEKVAKHLGLKPPAPAPV